MNSVAESVMAQARAFTDWLAPLRECEWVVYAKRPFAGPQAVLAYLSRYTRRVAISNQRFIALDECIETRLSIRASCAAAWMARLS